MVTVIPGELDPLQRGLATGLALGQQGKALELQRQHQEAQHDFWEARNDMLARELDIQEGLAELTNQIKAKELEIADFNLQEAITGAPLARREKEAGARAAEAGAATAEMDLDRKTFQFFMGLPQTEVELKRQELATLKAAEKQALDTRRNANIDSVLRILDSTQRMAESEQRIAESEARAEQLRAAIETGEYKREALKEELDRLPQESFADFLTNFVDPTGPDPGESQKVVDLLFELGYNRRIKDTPENRMVYGQMLQRMSENQERELSIRDERFAAQNAANFARILDLEDRVSKRLSDQEQASNRQLLAQQDDLGKLLIRLEGMTIAIDDPKEKEKHEKKIAATRQQIAEISSVVAGFMDREKYSKKYQNAQGPAGTSKWIPRAPVGERGSGAPAVGTQMVRSDGVTVTYIGGDHRLVENWVDLNAPR